MSNIWKRYGHAGFIPQTDSPPPVAVGQVWWFPETQEHAAVLSIVDLPAETSTSENPLTPKPLQRPIEVGYTLHQTYIEANHWGNGQLINQRLQLMTYYPPQGAWLVSGPGAPWMPKEATP